MKYASLLVACVLLCALESKAFEPRRNGKHVFRGWYGSVGLAAGQEIVLGLPRFGFYKDFLVGEPESAALVREGKGLRKSSLYVGAEGSLFVFIGGVFSAGITTGAKFGCFTIENSFSKTMVESPEGEFVAWYTSANPKIGFNVNKLWLKAGPSFLLKGDRGFPNWMRTGSVGWNVECLFLQRF